MPQQFTNNARALLASGITAAATSFTVEASKADLFPTANTDANPVGTATDWFKLTLQDTVGNTEIVYVRTRVAGSGLMANVQRAQEGTVARDFTAGTVVGLRMTAADVQAMLSGVYTNPLTAPSVSATTLTATGQSVAPKYLQAGVEGRIIPVRGIVMWSGTIAEIPVGWALCDGTNGTPDLRDKFIIGAGTDNASVASTNITGAATKTGGSKDLAVPAHTHTFSANTNTAGTHSHGASDSGHQHVAGQLRGDQSVWSGGNYGGYSDAAYVTNTTNVSGVGYANINIAADGAHAHTVSGTTATAGTSATNANLPPYYALAFIQALPA